MNNIPYGKQFISDEDINEVVKVLKSEFLTQGPNIAIFEKEFADYIGAKYAVAVANGTAALHLCAMALNVNPGDRVITTPITFAASSNCIRYCGGEVFFADIDPDTYLLDIQKVKALLEKHPKGYFKGIVAVDFGGFPIDLEAFRTLADEHGLWIIEDACHAPGGYFTDSKGKEQYCGNGNFADLAIFSFHPVKHIAAGEGGMITTNDKALYEKLLTLRTHGITRDAAVFENSPSFAAGQPLAEGAGYPGWYMEMQELGYNYRLTDFQAALGSSQLKRAADGLKRRKEIALRYDTRFKDNDKIHSLGIELKTGKASHAYHLYIIQVEKRLELYNYLRENKIFPQVHYIPTHLMPYYKQQGWKEGDFPLAEAYYTKCLSLPMYPTLTNEEQDFVIGKIIAFLNG